MKEYITEDQLKELSDVQEKKLNEWCKSKNYFDTGLVRIDNKIYPRLLKIPLLSIGKMIEFLEDQDLLYYVRDINMLAWDSDKELCDQLWDKIKDNL